MKIPIAADGLIGPEEYRVDCVSRSAFTTIDVLDDAFNKLLNVSIQFHIYAK
jgi:hypothetical protein